MLNRKSHNYWTVQWEALQLSGLVNYTHRKLISHMIWFLRAKFLTVGTYFNERFSLDRGSEITYQKYIVNMYSTLFNEAPVPTYKTHCLLVIQAFDIYCDLNHADLKFTKNFPPWNSNLLPILLLSVNVCIQHGTDTTEDRCIAATLELIILLMSARPVPG